MNHLTIKLVYAFFLLMPTLSKAGAPELFQEIEKIQKGPFGLNYMQGSKSRSSVKSGSAPAGTRLFDAAYRNEKAEELAGNFNFYTGNLFTTNYYQLMGEFVFGDPKASFALNNQALVDVGTPAMTKANNIVLDWVLEKYYIGHFPDSGLARGFNSRGIAGSEYEQEYAKYFFNFYLSLVEDSYQYLPAYLLAKQSPIVESSALAEARKLVKELYDYFANSWGSKDSRVRGLYKIRNAIHNNLSESVLKMIEEYLAANPWYAADGHTYLQKIHVMLTDYFNASPSDLKNIAGTAGLPGLESAAQDIVNKGVDPNTLFYLSEALVKAKMSVTTSEVALDKKATVFSAIVSASEYLNKETIRMGALDSTTKALTLLNMIFVEGLLIEDNWQYFYEEISNTKSKNVAPIVVDVLDIASMTLDEVFGAKLSAWVQASGQKSMEQFRDDALKSSSLNSVSVMLNQ